MKKKVEKGIDKPQKACYNSRAINHGPLVKRLRHGPLKAETGVRFSHGSPTKNTTNFGGVFCCLVTPWRRIAPDASKAMRNGSSIPRLTVSPRETSHGEADSPTESTELLRTYALLLSSAPSHHMLCASPLNQAPVREFAYRLRYPAFCEGIPSLSTKAYEQEHTHRSLADSPTKKAQVHFESRAFSLNSASSEAVIFIQDRRAWDGINSHSELHGIAARPRMASAIRLHLSVSLRS